MRHPLLTPAMAALALAAIAFVAPTRAGAAATKPADLQTIGAIVHPDASPADLHAPRLQRAPGANGARAIAVTNGEKPAAFTTQAPRAIAELDAAQRVKLAAAAELAAAAPAPVEIVTKPAPLSTITAAAPGTPSLSPQELMRRKQSPPASAAIGAHVTNTFGALGVIPRPEWSAARGAEKSADVTTIGPRVAGTTATPAPSAVELQLRAAPTAPAPAGPKPASVKTALPRDPSAPAADAAKPATPAEKQEVQP